VQEFPTDRVLELAFAAYRENGGYEKQTRRYSEDQVTQFSNKELVLYSACHYNRYNNPDLDDIWIPEDFVPLKVTDEDCAAKTAAEKHMSRYTMLALGNLSDFENDIFAAFSSEKITRQRIGLLAYLPEFVDRELKEREFKGRLKLEFADSAHINLHVIEEETVQVLKIVPLREYDTYLYFGGIGKDLVIFTKSDLLEIGEKYHIRARVKKHDQERKSGLPMTRINYVKLKKVEQ